MQYLKSATGETAYKLGNSNATEEMELEKIGKVDHVALLKKYNAVFRDKACCFFCENLWKNSWLL